MLDQLSRVPRKVNLLSAEVACVTGKVRHLVIDNAWRTTEATSMGIWNIKKKTNLDDTTNY